MQISQLVLKFENVSKALTTEVKHVVNGPKKPRKKVTEIRRYYNWNCSQYIKLNAAYKIRARQTNKLSKSAFSYWQKIYNLCFPLSGQAQKYFPLLGQDVPWDISCSISSKVSIYPTPRIHISQSIKKRIFKVFFYKFCERSELNWQLRLYFS